MQPKILTFNEHRIEQKFIDSDALSIIERLKQAGFCAYLVGGSVRDLLIQKAPKDFDISTSALPEQIKRIFGRNCLLIGRRFRLAHIRFGSKVIEVSTFRSGENQGDLILRDNQWGTAEEDILRRDFTINGLFYDPQAETVIDYVGGWEDLHNRSLRSIGSPRVRFRQDPVRMLRLLKFRARLGFQIERATEEAMYNCRDEIMKSSAARILEEILRMLESGAATPFFQELDRLGFLELLFPTLTHCLALEGEKMYRYLMAADKLHQNKYRLLDRAVLLSCLLYPILEKELETQYFSQGKLASISDIMMLSSSLIHAFVTSSFPHFPKRLSEMVNFILSTQYRLTPLTGKRCGKLRLFHLKEFAEALQFLKVRTEVDLGLASSYSRWKELYKNSGHHPLPDQAKGPRHSRLQELGEEVEE